MRFALFGKQSRKLSTWWARLPIRRKGTIVIAIPSVFLLITLGAWVWSRQMVTMIRARIDYSEAVIQQSQNLQALLVDAEAGMRGYIFTRDSTFLQPYRHTQAVIEDEFAQLKKLVQQDAQRLSTFQRLEALGQQRLSLLETVLTETQSQPSQGALVAELLPLLYQGKQVMGQFRDVVSAIEQSETQVLSRYNQQRDRVNDLTTQVLWFTVIISLLSLFLAISLFSTLDQTLQDRDLMLHESKSLLQAIVSSVVDGVVTLDRNGKIELLNPSAAQMFEYQPYEVIGKRLDFLLENSTPPNIENLAQAKVADFRWQTKGLPKTGLPFAIEVSMSDVQLENRRQIVIIRDITEFQQVEAKLQSRADELARLTTLLAQTNVALENRNQELEQFAYVASHDLKAPLRAIANLAAWLEEDLDGQLPEENQHQMRLLRGRVLRMEALINGLLDYLRVGRTQTPTELVSVEALLFDIIDSLDPPATFTITVRSGMPTLYTKRVLLRQVFANLISNAIMHHDRQNGQITVSVAEQGRHYKFLVTDDGPGIASQYHDKIFVMFQTLEARDVKESTGIGLSIVKKIVESEGGTIRVESQIGSGATFSFTWPKQVQEDQ